MASNNNFSCYYEEPMLEKLPACTMKRYPKMDLNKSDMLQLLSYLEGELQARDIVVAALNVEKVKQLVATTRRHGAHPTDPLFALQRDSELMRDSSFGESEVKLMYDEQLRKLENLIAVQHAAQKSMRDILAIVEKKYHKISAKLDIDQKSHIVDVEQDLQIAHLLENVKERIKQELDQERSRRQKIEDETRSAISSVQEESSNDAFPDHDTIVAVQLIKEQTQIMKKMGRIKAYLASLSKELKEEKKKADDLEKSVAEETERLMHEEATQEKQLSEFDFEKQQLLARLSKAEAQQQELLEELEKLQQQSTTREGTEGQFQMEALKAEQNGLKVPSPSSVLRLPSTTGSHQPQTTKRPSSAQPGPTKLQPPYAPRQQPPHPQQSNAPRTLSASLAPTHIPAAPVPGIQQTRIRTFGIDSVARMSSQNLQGPVARRQLPQGSKVPPPVPPNKPQVPILPQVHQPSLRLFRPANT